MLLNFCYNHGGSPFLVVWFGDLKFDKKGGLPHTQKYETTSRVTFLGEVPACLAREATFRNVRPREHFCRSLLV
jgi:hypothetical protein